MSVSDAEFAAWLLKDAAKRELLAEWAVKSGGVATTRYMSRLGYITGPADTPPHQIYEDLLLRLPAYSVRASELFTGRTLPTWADPEIDNSNGARDSWLDDIVDGRPIVFYMGAPEWARADFRRVFSGVSSELVPTSSNRLLMRLRGREQLLNRELQTTLIGGTTANLNQPVPIAVGQCFNVEARCIDGAGFVWQVNDGLTNAITPVRVNGVATVPSVTNLTTGTITFSAAAAGRVTADVQGAKPAGVYLTKTGEILMWLLKTYAGLVDADLDLASFTALDVAAPYTIGFYIRDRINVIDMIDQIVTGIGAAWTFTRGGQLRLFRLDAPTGTAALTLGRDDIIEKHYRKIRNILPVALARVMYQKNWCVQSAGELAAAVTDTNRTLYSTPYQLKTTPNSVSDYLTAPRPVERLSLIAGGADAQTESDRVALLYSVPRGVYETRCFAGPCRTNLGDLVSVTYPRYGADAGRLGVTVAVTDQLIDAAISLELFA